MRSTEITETPFYICPNNCQDAFFYCDGTLSATEFLTETGEHIEYKTGDFTPSEKVVKCRRCGAVATKKKKRVTVTMVIEIE